jgi:hypothetical protein
MHHIPVGSVLLKFTSSVAPATRTLMPHLARSAPLSFIRLKIADDPKETGDRVRVPKVARVLVARRFALVPQAAKVVDHALESLDVGHSRTISSTGHVDPLALAHAAGSAWLESRCRTCFSDRRPLPLQPCRGSVSAVVL